MILTIPLKENLLIDRQLNETFNQKLKEYKIMCNSKSPCLELWNNIKQLEDNMFKSDTTFWNNWKDFSENKNCSNIEISDDHIGLEKHTIIRPKYITLLLKDAILQKVSAEV